MSSFKIELKGLQQVQKAIKDIPKNLGKDIAAQFNGFGDAVVEDAIRFAPTDEGLLKSARSISHTKATPDNLEIEIVVNVSYAAYVEFGTRKFAARYVATLPPDWQTFAKSFQQGKGATGGEGSIEEMLIRLTAWVKRKGFAAHQTKSGNASKSKSSIEAQENAAYVIALRILQNGVRAHPFLYPAVTKNKPLLIASLNALLK